VAKSLDTHFIEIGENKKELAVTDWSTRKTYRNLFKLGKLFAPISSAITEAVMGGERLQEVIPGVLLFICEEMNDDGFDKFFKMVTEDVTGEGGIGKLDMDDLEPDEVLEVLTKCLEIYYKPFFQKALTQVKSLMQETMKVANLDKTLNKGKKA
jgi:hypothetical protein